MNDKERDELNRYLDTKIMGKCAGNWIGKRRTLSVLMDPCIDCRKTWDYHLDLPDYCSDLNAVRRVELAVIEKVGEREYWDALLKPFNYHDIPHGTLKAAMATALERARACRAAVEGGR